nr:hypothetical protein [uncultured bacterium]
MASTDTHTAESLRPGPLLKGRWHLHGRHCPTYHLQAFRKLTGKWRGTVTQYSLDGQVLATIPVEAENRLGCNSLYTLLVFTDPQGNQQRVEFTSFYSRKLDGFVVDNPALKGTARQAGDSVVYTYENRSLPTPNLTIETVSVQGDTRLHTLQSSSGARFTGYAIIRETRVVAP